MSSYIIDFNSNPGDISYRPGGKPEEQVTEYITQNGEYTLTPNPGRTIGKANVTVEVNPALQEKTVYPATVDRTIAADDGFYGLSSVEVKKMKLGPADINPDIVDSRSYASENNLDGFSSVLVRAVTSSIDSNIQAENIKNGVSILGVLGTLTPDVPAVVQSVTVYPEITDQNYSPAQGVDGFNLVTVKGVDSSIDSNIQPENIAEGVEILGVTGTLSGSVDIDTEYNSLQNILGKELISWTGGGVVRTLKIDGTSYTNLSQPITNSKGSSVQSVIFNANTDIVSLNTLDLTNVTSMSFLNCTSLQSVSDIAGESGVLDWKGTSLISFMGCSSLSSVEMFCDNVKSLINAFKDCTSLTWLSLYNLGQGITTLAKDQTFDLSTCPLGEDAVVNLFESIYDVSSKGFTKNLNIKLSSNTYSQLSASDIAIATGKGWTVIQ